MQDNPTIKVEVQGHTDSVGNDRFNLKLSQKRAESVKAYLVKQGVSADRMVPKGYGENVPIADNRTKDGRAQNRRVEFVITER
jgi:OOP family OmpA-OmpF porin